MSEYKPVEMNVPMLGLSQEAQLLNALHDVTTRFTLSLPAKIRALNYVRDMLADESLANDARARKEGL